MGVLTRRAAALLLVLIGSVGHGERLDADEASAPQLTAAFLLNFVKFTTWPDGAPPAGAPIVVCVLDSDRVLDALTELGRGQSVGGRAIQVRRATLPTAADTCQVIYSGDTDGRRSVPLIQATQGRPVLTVGAGSDFAARGGVANFFVDSGRMRFAVNTTAANRAQLRISSKLLNLARIIQHDGPL